RSGPPTNPPPPPAAPCFPRLTADARAPHSSQHYRDGSDEHPPGTSPAPHPYILLTANSAVRKEPPAMLKFLLFCILLVVCWPLALLALLLYPIIWLITLPFRLVGIAVTGVFALITAIFLFPARILP